MKDDRKIGRCRGDEHRAMDKKRGSARGHRSEISSQYTCRMHWTRDGPTSLSGANIRGLWDECQSSGNFGVDPALHVPNCKPYYIQ
jgi:hypothetical protein